VETDVLHTVIEQ